MLERHTKSTPLGGKLVLSTGLVLVSGAYAYWQHVTKLAWPGILPMASLAAPSVPAASKQAVPAQMASAVPDAAAPSAPAAQSAMRQSPAAKSPTAQSPITQSPMAVTAASPPGTQVLSEPGVGGREQPMEAAPPASSMPGTVYTSASTGAVPTAIHNWHYADGDWTGQVADTAWGPVQVKVGIRNGVMNEIRWLMYPDHRDESIQINTTAMPQLSSEAIQSQSADVDKTTQATFTTQGFQSSLYTALEQAKRP